jgi:MFS family permease
MAVALALEQQAARRYRDLATWADKRVLLGAYIMSWVADRYGRRPAILMSTLLGGLFLWPFAHVFDFWPLVVLSVLSTLGVGGIVATHAVYLSELIAPTVAVAEFSP